MMGELEKVERPCDPKRELKHKLISSSVSNFKRDNVNVMSLDVGADFKFIFHASRNRFWFSHFRPRWIRNEVVYLMDMVV